MGWEDRIGQHLEWEDCMHAVGQGALGVECAQENEAVVKLLSSLNHPPTYFRCLAERGFLRTLEGGCSVPVAVTSALEIQDGMTVIRLRGTDIFCDCDCLQIVLRVFSNKVIVGGRVCVEPGWI
jgi:hydroxymethylbilane synthase